VREPWSDAVERWLVSGTAAVGRLSEVEVASALARRARAGDCDVRARDVGLAALECDFRSFLVVEVVPAVTSRARSLLNAYPLRASDAIQLASCYDLQGRLGRDVPFVVFDERLAAVARKTGAIVLGAGSDSNEPT
jgi:predicted nucleic acid-binding protein